VKQHVPDPLDPDLAGMLEAMRASGATALHTVSPHHARRGYAKLARALAVPATPSDMAVVDYSIEDRIPVRVYRSAHREPTHDEEPGGTQVIGRQSSGPEITGRGSSGSGEGEPVVVYLHGGGWVVGDLDTHAQLARDICRCARATVVAVDYQRAPESPFPAALDDVIAVIRWLLEVEPSVGATTALGIVGDSAGANLAISALVRAPELKRHVDDLLLAYPLVQHESHTKSRVDLAEGYMLETATVEWFSRMYAGDLSVEELNREPMANPLEADLDALPPTRVIVAGFDLLRDEGVLLAERCHRFGVEVDLVEESAMLHGFLELGAASAAAAAISRRELAALGERLRRCSQARGAAGPGSAQ